MFSRTGASVVMAVLVIAMSAGGADAQTTCAAVLDTACPPGTVVDTTAQWTNAETECCTLTTCASGGSATKCNSGFYFDGAATFTGAGTACTGITPECFTGLTECCATKFCDSVDADGNSFCPYGYVVKSGVSAVTTLTVEACCDRASTVSSTDATDIAFPVCQSARSGGTTGAQASSLDDTNWALQDDNAFSRTLGQYTGMCFSVKIDNDCSDAESLIAPKCCTKKAPAYLQFKLPLASGVTDDAGVALTTMRAKTLTNTNVRKCKLSYGTPTVTLRGLKPITRWLTVDAAVGADGRFFNVPVTFKRGAKQATVCVYSNSLVTPGVDCTWETLCGLSDETVPTEDGSFAKGCEMRLAGRQTRTSAPCCSPTYSVESFDSNAASRIAGGSDVTSAIEIVAPGSN